MRENTLLHCQRRVAEAPDLGDTHLLHQFLEATRTEEFAERLGLAVLPSDEGAEVLGRTCPTCGQELPI